MIAYKTVCQKIFSELLTVSQKDFFIFVQVFFVIGKKLQITQTNLSKLQLSSLSIVKKIPALTLQDKQIQTETISKHLILLNAYKTNVVYTKHRTENKKCRILKQKVCSLF